MNVALHNFAVAAYRCVFNIFAAQNNDMKGKLFVIHYGCGDLYKVNESFFIKPKP